VRILFINMIIIKWSKALRKVAYGFKNVCGILHEAILSASANYRAQCICALLVSSTNENIVKARSDF